MGPSCIALRLRASAVKKLFRLWFVLVGQVVATAQGSIRPLRIARRVRAAELSAPVFCRMRVW